MPRALAGHGGSASRMAPVLRLAGGEASGPVGRLAGDAAGHAPRIGAPIDGPGDPRWVLAVRVAEALEGPILRPEPREKLLRLGRALGLTAFDANLVIAVVQDQARRGHAPRLCPTQGVAQLEMVPLPASEPMTPLQRWVRVGVVIAGALVLELMVLLAIFR